VNGVWLALGALGALGAARAVRGSRDAGQWSKGTRVRFTPQLIGAYSRSQQAELKRARGVVQGSSAQGDRVLYRVQWDYLSGTEALVPASVLELDFDADALDSVIKSAKGRR